MSSAFHWFCSFDGVFLVTFFFLSWADFWSTKNLNWFSTVYIPLDLSTDNRCFAGQIVIATGQHWKMLVSAHYSAKLVCFQHGTYRCHQQNNRTWGFRVLEANQCCGLVDQNNSIEYRTWRLDTDQKCRVDCDERTPGHCCFLTLHCLVLVHVGLKQLLFLLLACHPQSLHSGEPVVDFAAFRRSQ